MNVDLLDNPPKESDAQGFDEDGSHWRLGPLLQSLSGLPTLAELGKSLGGEKLN